MGNSNLKLVCIFSLFLTLSLPSFSQNAAIEPLDSEKLKGKVEHDIVVAQDGSGHFKTIGEALDAIRVYLPKPLTVYIKPGIYKEKLTILGPVINVTFEGENPENTIISFDDYASKDNMGTFETYTLKVLGSSLTFKNLTIQNTAGSVGQAVALHAEGDRLVFENCRFLGDQDTMFASGENSRQLYKNCYIEGTTDFIFGSATALFDNCVIHSKADSYITAASTPEWVEYGYVFKDCKLTADAGVKKVYLGRPWRDFAKTVFIDTEMGAHIVPEGWHNWGRENAEQTVFYAESGSFGSGAISDSRIDWSYQLRKEDLKKYSNDLIFSGKTKDADYYGNRWFGFEKDSSFNLEDAWKKDVKNFPQIKPVYIGLNDEVTEFKDSIYKELGRRKLKVDVFSPKGVESLRPAIVMIHGGGWKSGDKELQIPMAIALAEKGFVAAVVEYRLSPEAQYPAAIHDVKEAIRWLKAHAMEFGIDTSRIAISGSSAGGQIAALVGLTSTQEYEGETELEASAEVQAIIDMDGVLAFHHPESAEGQVASEWLGGTYEQKPEVWNAASPLYLPLPNMKPILFINSQYPRFHAGRDELVTKLDEEGIYSEVHTFPDTPHPFWLYDPWFERTVNTIAEFLNKVFL
ncbi:pectinesterase family protein [Algoriphagus sp. D3-2-R+10]|uniref:pectinesterase family protein n=1 Tax=Algoriphagus aurantiacus TaxID=3103948 RepID=UPI002B3F8DFE|nr:pectinesterase family protein [Algoriphagus sp. D3-2-R+10]MEB2777784.1 pectinesterase family protein [Algoriphagus sp. D3-2-R+10]